MGQDRRNVRALKAWADDGAPGWGLEERIQLLDGVLAGAWKLSEPGGRYSKVVKRFERWVEGVEGILEARKKSGGGFMDADGEGEDMFVEELDGEWKAELESLARKLGQWREQLRSLGEVSLEGSSLALVVRGVRELVNGMGEEVRAMERVERSVMATEEVWIREAIEGDEDGDEGRTAGAVWRTI